MEIQNGAYIGLEKPLFGLHTANQVEIEFAVASTSGMRQFLPFTATIYYLGWMSFQWTHANEYLMKSHNVVTDKHKWPLGVTDWCGEWLHVQNFAIVR